MRQPCRGRFVIVAALAAILPVTAAAQQDDPDIARWMAMDLAELQDTRIVSVATGRQSLSIRESPGTITAITGDELRASGARHPIDVLRLFPGFEFGVDTYGVVDLGTRGMWGMWGFESKILVLLDGVEFDETLLGTVPLGNHLPIDRIERIEIIRRPGSTSLWVSTTFWERIAGGLTLGFHVVDERPRILVNRDAAAAEGARFSSRLLELADLRWRMPST